MPGLFSTIFEDEGGEDTSQSSQTYEASGEGEANLSPEIAVHNEMGGSYDNLDGSTTSWERSDDVSVDADVGASLAFDAVATVDQSDGF